MYVVLLSILHLQIPLQVLMKSEQYTEEMIDIMGKYQEYVGPKQGTSDEMITVMFGGDQLTVERAWCVKRAKSQSQSSDLRLDGLHPKIEDWHGLVVFYEVCTYTSMHTL